MRLTGMYRALVVDNVDPEGLRRIRFQVPQVMGGHTSGWAYPIPAIGGAVPTIGQMVWAQFEGGDPSFPLYQALTDTSSIVTSISALSDLLAAHTSATSGVHGASGSVVGTTGTQTLTNKTVSGLVNTISDVPISGVTGLSTVLAALASTSSLSSHISATVAHGTTGNVVGTTDTQTLTNKTLTTPTITDPALSLESSAEISATAGRLGYQPGGVLWLGNGTALPFKFSSDSLSATTADRVVATGSASTVALVAKAFTGQTANIQEWRDASNALTTYVDSGGRLINKIPSVLTQVTANSAAVSTVETTLITAPAITGDGVTKVKITFACWGFVPTVSGDSFAITVKEGATQLGMFNFQTASTAGRAGCPMVTVVLTPAAGSHTYSVTLLRAAGTGTATMSAGATTPAVLMVEQFAG